MTKEGKADKRRLKLGVILRGIVLIVSLVAGGYFLETTPLGDMMKKEWIDNEVKGQGGLTGEMLFLGIGTLITAVGLPRQAVSFFGGYAFGVAVGGLLALTATLLGCVTAFYYSRFLGRGLVRDRFNKRVKKIDKFMHDNPLGMALLIRLLPVGSNILTNLAAGVSSVRSLPFFAGSAIGFIPQTLVFALIGSGVNLDPVFRIGMGVVLFVLSCFLGVALYRKYRHGHTLDKETENQLR
ncbi:MAG: TVP38/TMEM64 family protein [Gammaproteobacteria bacterium]